MKTKNNLETAENLHEKNIDLVVQWLRESKRVLFITGAGISADSGLPTYRGIGGLYDDKTTDEGFPIEVALSGEMFREKPEITWKYIMEIGNAVLGAKPNRGHEVIALFEERFRSENKVVWVLTQNIDGYHTEAGTKNLIEIHGSIHRFRCEHCEHIETIPIPKTIPNCSICGKPLRPDIVLFNERLPHKALTLYTQEVENDFDLVLSIGTSATFHYIIAPVYVANWHGKPTVEINPAETDLSKDISVCLPFRAAEVLDKIWSRYNELSPLEA